MTSPVSAFVVALFLVGAASAAKVPSTWKVCKRSLPPAEYDPCIKDAVMGAVADLASKGQPSLGIPPINPLKITALDIGQGSGPVAIDLHFTDLEIGGVDGVQILNIKHKDVEKYQFGADIAMKKPLTLKSKYTLNGKVLVLPIKGNGNCDLSMDNVKATIDLTGTPFQKGDETYMNLTKMDIKFDTDRLHLAFENLFDGNKELGNQMNTFLNENWAEILKELKPAIIEAFAAAFTSISNQIFHKVPYTKLFPQ